MSDDLMRNLGPVGVLAGVWEGAKGDDTAPSDDRGTEHNKFRERMTFEPIRPVCNHEQTLYGLRYATMAWPLGEDSPFHEEVGSETYGICSNRFLDEEFKTVRYDLKITIHDDDSFSYEEDTQIRIKGQPEMFHHIDKNTVKRVRD